MAELNKWVPSDVLEPIKRFLDGDLTMSPSIKVEQFQDGDHPGGAGGSARDRSGPGRRCLRERGHAAHPGRARGEDRAQEQGRVPLRVPLRLFLRSVALPPGAKEEDITATYKDGVLEVRAPAPGHAPDTTAKKIRIDHT